MVWVIAFGELFFGDLWCVVWGYGGMRTHFSLLNPHRGFRYPEPDNPPLPATLISTITLPNLYRQAGRQGEVDVLKLRAPRGQKEGPQRWRSSRPASRKKSRQASKS